MPAVTEVTDQTFETRVVEESLSRLVVVDLWAEWCAPCRQLGPVLESLAHEKGGAFLLAKIDVDANPLTAQVLNAMSIPAVKAFAGGQLVDEFTGALPAEEVRRWVEALLPSEVDELVASGRALEEQGDNAGAEARFREALSLDPTDREASVGLGRLLVAGGSDDEARELLMRAVPDPEAEELLAALRVRGWAGVQGGDELSVARQLAVEGRWREALDLMLALLGEAEDARQAILDVFAACGDDDLVREYRPKLAAALF